MDYLNKLSELYPELSKSGLMVNQTIYDKNNKLLEINNGTSVILYDYNEENLEIRRTCINGDYTEIVEYEYDNHNRIVKSTTTVNDNIKDITIYEYNEDGKLHKKYSSNGLLIIHIYNGNKVITISDPNNVYYKNKFKENE